MVLTSPLPRGVMDGNSRTVCGAVPETADRHWHSQCVGRKNSQWYSFDLGRHDHVGTSLGKVRGKSITQGTRIKWVEKKV